MDPPVILFLDFDGTCHPFDCVGAGVDYFCYLPRIEAVLRDFDFVKIVISSEWRRFHPLPELLQRFAGDMRPRVLGVTPAFPNVVWEPALKGIRRREAMAFIEHHGFDTERWLALDDIAILWEPLESNVILCADGFLEEEEAQLRRWLTLKAEG